MTEEPITPSQPKGVKRYSAVPLVAGVTVASVILAVLIMSLSGNDQEKESLHARNAESEVARLKQNNKRDSQSYWFESQSIPAPPPAPPAPDPWAAEDGASLNDLAPAAGSAPLTEFDRKVQEEYEKAELEMVRFEARQPLSRMQKHEEGVRAPLHVINLKEARQGKNVTAAGSAATGNPSGPRIIGFNQQQPALAALQGSMQADYDAQNSQSGKSDFLVSDAKAVADNYLMDTLHEPISPYEVKAGTVIPAALITGINSDLPGSIIAQVREHVYDTVSGNYLLIPQGSRLIGQYDSQVSFGQNRALVVWNRLIMPDGNSIDLGKMQGVDIAGYAGFKDRVDNHYMRIYGNALLMSLVGAGYDLMANPSGNPYDDNDAQDTIAANIGLQLAQVTEQLTRKNINIQPTIEIRQGYRFNVMVLKDMVLRPR